ncbi:hypothetical protein [Hydrogenimonas urashimensis]|uniref:hypothetical protein n=1 Tax=Hydrogenimonas urashimensis TaxID=2740515 RepID=UPI001915FB2A|nr:hypothetical protein [Hydrogenimonas urashimensis]
MTKLLELIDIIKMAVALYKKAGYEAAKQRLINEIEKRDDKTTIDELHSVIHD